jgi:hypothetical protein
MAHSAIITTPMPTLDELGERLGLSKAKQKYLIRLVDEKGSRRSTSYAFKTLVPSSKSEKNGTKKAFGMARKTKSSARKTA